MTDNLSTDFLRDENYGLKDRNGIDNLSFLKQCCKAFFLFFGVITFCLTLHAQNTEDDITQVSIKSLDRLQYDVVRFKVKPKAKIKISLTNVSDMSHNLVVTKPGARLNVVNSALRLAEKGPEMNYTPKMSEVLLAIPVVSPGQTKSVTFTAPAQEGVYPYVCTYPGHGFVMYGAMYVTNNDTLPDLKNDLNIPDSRRQDSMTAQKDETNMHNHNSIDADTSQLIPPYFYNAFLEGASPAAVAVRLPHDLSYCWDETSCRLRFAWKGGFVDMSDLWKGHFNASAKILGDIFFIDNTDAPIRMGNNATIPVPRFKGYRLINRYPEFHYTLNGLDVYEIIYPKEDGKGLICDFRIPDADQTIWLYTNSDDDAIEYNSSKGKWKDRKLQLTPTEAKAFTVTMTSYYLTYKKNRKK